MWYLYTLLGLYAFTPVLRAFTASADRKTAMFFLLFLYIFYIFTAFRSTLISATSIEFVQILPSPSVHLFYYLLGHYLSRWEIGRGKVVAAMVVGLTGLTGILILELNGYEMDGTAFVALYSAALFVLCKNAHILTRLAEYPWMQALSNASFGIYLLHPIFIHSLYRVLHIYPDILPMVLGEAVILFVVLACSYISTLLLKIIRPLSAIL